MVPYRTQCARTHKCEHSRATTPTRAPTRQSADHPRTARCTHRHPLHCSSIVDDGFSGGRRWIFLQRPAPQQLIASSVHARQQSRRWSPIHLIGRCPLSTCSSTCKTRNRRGGGRGNPPAVTMIGVFTEAHVRTEHQVWIRHLQLTVVSVMM